MGKRKNKKIRIEQVIASFITLICIGIASYFGVQNKDSNLENNHQIAQNNMIQTRKYNNTRYFI